MIINQMEKKEQTETQKGLYQAEYEHDACGVGMIVNIHGSKSHELVDNALRVLENMRHRGAEIGKELEHRDGQERKTRSATGGKLRSDVALLWCASV